MVEVVWSFQASADFEAIAEYIARDSEFYAAAFVQEALAAGKTLDSFSSRGRVVPELRKKTIREIFIKEYRLIYYIAAVQIIILSVIHMKRKAGRIIKARAATLTS